MKQRFLLLFFAVTFSVVVQANASSMAAIRKQESELVNLYRTLSTHIFSAERDSLAQAFRNNMNDLLKEEISSGYNFDSLRRYVTICKSNDGKVRTFSWDELEGGNWHNMAAFAQYRTATGKIAVAALDAENEPETGGFSDVRIYNIYELPLNGQTAYLLIGSGTHGAGMHHAQARVFSVQQENFEINTTVFGSQQELVTEIPRSLPPDMRYDEKKGILHFNSYSFGDETTGKGRGLKPVEYVFQNGKFVLL